MRDQLGTRGIPRDRIHLIPNAWSARHAPESREVARRTLGVPDTAFLIGWVGRLSREKAPDVLVAALRDLDGEDVTVSFIGDGPLRSEISVAPSSSGGPVVRAHGAIAGASRLFPAFDLFVLSSRTEGTPIALFEAMEASVPIVATAVGGVPDVLGHEGILVPPDDPGALATAIRSVRRDLARARERAARARTRLVTEFARGPWLDRYDALYSSLLPNHPGPR
jgi:glycosyltransferase involved in cell wall biosynthesis